ncbi:MAG: hypothetical protein HYR56_27220 [Acidobacteria bacterium]|nr:hypothetical protein [Acidobacteriota bacterium]
MIVLRNAAANFVAGDVLHSLEHSNHRRLTNSSNRCKASEFLIVFRALYVALGCARR